MEPRALDEWDLLALEATVDLHADTPLHNLTLEGNGHPGFAMRAWMGLMKALGVLFPRLRNFTRQVTLSSLAVDGRGLQVFCAVTRGLPPFYRSSHTLYTRGVARWRRGSVDTALNAWVAQAAWVYREVAAHPERLVLTPDFASAAAAMGAGKVAVQLGIEGAFPFDPTELDVGALRAFLPALGAEFPRPTEAELQAPGGLLRYARRLGVQYLSLNHLASSCFAGSDLRPNSKRGAGISESGRRLVKQAEEAGIMLDLAHASQRAQQDAVELVARGGYRLPLLVSHARVALAGEPLHWRMTRASVLEAVQMTGGIIGVMGARRFLPHGDSPDPRVVIRDIADQVDCVRARIGVDFVGLGLDADGFVGLPFATSAEVAAVLKIELRARGYSEAELLKIYGGNYLHVLRRAEHPAHG